MMVHDNKHDYFGQCPAASFFLSDLKMFPASGIRKEMFLPAFETSSFCKAQWLRPPLSNGPYHIRIFPPLTLLLHNF
jgi:hypothetical protein